MESSTKSVSVDIVMGRRSVIAEAYTWVPTPGRQSISVYSTGEAVRHPDDDGWHDETVGINLAVGRALEGLARKVLKQANGVIAQNEHNKWHSLENKGVPDKRKMPDGRCHGTTNEGKRCRQRALVSPIWCRWHDPLGEW